MTPTIIFTGGGTLGSVTPLLAVSTELKRRRPEWKQYWIGTNEGPERALIAPHMPYLGLPSVKLRRYLSLATVMDAVRFPLVWWRAFRVLQPLHPSLIVGAGGFVSVPVAWAGKMLGAKVLIHQQDIRAGLANRLIAPFATSITTAFPDAARVYPPAKVRVVGNPVRADFLQADADRGRQAFGRQPDRPLLVVIGGGTGSAALNSLTMALKDRLAPLTDIIHITGRDRSEPVQPTPTYQPIEMVTDGLADLLAAATVVVSRAGLGTLTELSALRKATIVIPMPHSHQEENAASLAAAQAAVVLNQPELTPDMLYTTIVSLLNDAHRRHELGEQIGQWNKPDATNTITTAIERLIG